MDIEDKIKELKKLVYTREKEIKFLKIMDEINNQDTPQKKNIKTNVITTTDYLKLIFSVDWETSKILKAAVAENTCLILENSNHTTVSDFFNRLYEMVESETVTNKILIILECVKGVISCQSDKIVSFLTALVTILLKKINIAETQRLKYEFINTLETCVYYCGTFLQAAPAKEIYKFCREKLISKNDNYFSECYLKCLRTIIYNRGSLLAISFEEESELMLKIYGKQDQKVRDQVVLSITELMILCGAAQIKLHKVNPKPKDEIFSVTQKPKYTIDTIMNFFLDFCLKKKMLQNSVIELACKVYHSTFVKLGSSYFENNAGSCLRNMCYNLLPGERFNISNKYELLNCRFNCCQLLETIVHEILNENSCVIVTKSIMDFLKELRTSKTNNDKSKVIEICLLDALNQLIYKLKDTITNIAETIVDPLFEMLENSSHTVQVYISLVLNNISRVVPDQLSKLIFKTFEYFQKNLFELGTHSLQQSDIRTCVAYGSLLSAINSQSALMPDSFTYDLESHMFSTAYNTLKLSQLATTAIDSKEFYTMNSLKTKISWSILSSLMCKGPDYVQFIQFQIVELFEIYMASIPLPNITENILYSSEICVAVESCLQCMVLYLKHNKSIIGLKYTKRVLACLSQSILYISDFKKKYTSLEHSFTKRPHIKKITALLNSIFRKTLECYLLIDTTLYETMYSSLIKICIDVVTISDKVFVGDIFSSWCVFNNTPEAYFQVLDHECQRVLKHQHNIKRSIHNTNTIKSQPNFIAYENDSLYLYCTPNESSTTRVTICSNFDSSVSLLSAILPYMMISVQESTVMSLAKLFMDREKDASLDYLYVNFMIILENCFYIIERSSCENSKKTPQMHGDKTIATIQIILMKCMHSKNSFVNSYASDVLGRFCKIVGRSFLSRQMVLFHQKILQVRDLEVKRANISAIKSIYKDADYVAHTSKTTELFHMFLSLACDKNSIIYLPSLDTLSYLVDSLGSSSTKYSNDIIKLILQVLMSLDNRFDHNISNNFHADTDLLMQHCSRLLYVVICNIGPDINLESDSCFIIKKLVIHGYKNDNANVAVGFVKCLEMLIYFGHNYIDVSLCMKTIQGNMLNNDKIKQIAIVGCLSQIAKKHLVLFLEALSGPFFIEKIFCVFDTHPTPETEDLLKIACINLHPDYYEKWIEVSNKILCREELDLEEISSLSMNKISKASFFIHNNKVLLVENHTHTIVLMNLRLLITNMHQSTKSDLERRTSLISNISKLMKISFNATTSKRDKISIEGYLMYKEIIKAFYHEPDPISPENSILDQYIAQISTSFNSSLSTNSIPVLVHALEACRIFISRSCHDNTSKSSKFVRIMNVVLDNIQKKEDNETSDIFKNEKIAVSVLKEWSILAIESASNETLKIITEPNMKSLNDLWFRYLCQYSKTCIDSGILPDVGGVNYINYGLMSSFEMIKNINVKYTIQAYGKAWKYFLKILTLNIKSNDKDLCYKMSTKHHNSHKNFWIVFGLCMNILAHPTKYYNGVFECLECIDALMISDIIYSPVLNFDLICEITDILNNVKRDESIVCVVFSIFSKIIKLFYNNLEKDLILDKNEVQIKEIDFFIAKVLDYVEGVLDITNYSFSKDVIDKSVDIVCEIMKISSVKEKHIDWLYTIINKLQLTDLNSLRKFIEIQEKHTAVDLFKKEIKNATCNCMNKSVRSEFLIASAFFCFSMLWENEEYANLYFSMLHVITSDEKNDSCYYLVLALMNEKIDILNKCIKHILKILLDRYLNNKNENTIFNLGLGLISLLKRSSTKNRFSYMKLLSQAIIDCVEANNNVECVAKLICFICSKSKSSINEEVLIKELISENEQETQEKLISIIKKVMLKSDVLK